MNESDLLRPLREFVSDSDVRGQRPIFALLPALKEPADRHRLCLQLRIRYGVHVLYFGHRVRLHHTHKFISDLIEILENTANSKASLRAASLIGRMSDFLETLPDSDDMSDQVQGSGDGPPPQTIEAAMKKCFRDDSVEQKTYEFLFERMSDGSFSLTDKNERAAALDFLSRLRDKLITAALCHEIGIIADGWRTWWNEWQVKPERRDYRPRTTTVKDKEGREIDCYIRHPISHNLIRAQTGFEEAPREWEQVDAILSKRLKDLQKTLRSEINSVPVNKGNRRVIVIRNGRGGGKGILFREMMTYFSEFHPEYYRAAFFTHTSFSCEFGSVVEELIQFLIKQTGDDTKLSSGDRSSRLSNLLKKWRDAPNTSTTDNTGSRVLLVFRGLEALSGRSGHFLGSEVQEIVSTLLDPANQILPLDLVFMIRSDAECQWLPELRDPPDPKNDTENENVWTNVTDAKLHILYELPRLAWSESIEYDELLKKSWKLFEKSRKSLETIDERTSQHSFARAILTAAIQELFDARDQNVDVVAEWLQSVEHAVSIVPEPRRADIVLKEVIDLYDSIDYDKSNSLRNQLLRHLAIFSLPVESPIFQYCPQFQEIVGPTNSEERTKITDQAFAKLLQRRLIFRLQARLSRRNPDMRCTGSCRITFFVTWVAHLSSSVRPTSSTCLCTPYSPLIYRRPPGISMSFSRRLLTR